MGKLTVRQIENAKPKSAPYKLIDGEGLQLRVATNGIKTWLVRYTVANTGNERQYQLPEHYRMEGGEGFASLADARDHAGKIRALARQGIDYKIQQEEMRKAEALRRELEVAEAKTIRDLFEAWLPETERKDKGAELRRSFARDVLPVIGATPVKNIEESDLRAILSSVVGRGANRLAVMMLADMKQMFRWGEKQRAWRKLIDYNPAEPIKSSKITSDDYEGNERSRSLSADEIQELALKLPAAGLPKRTELACWIMLSCCCRIGELTKAKWADINFETCTWKIPKENAKNNTEHVVNLSAFALRQFKQLREITDGIWCYPNRSSDSHVCVKSITKQIGDRQIGGANRGPMMHRSNRAYALILSDGEWVPHDLRRTGSTLMQKLGISPIVIDRALNHTEPNKLKRIYQTYDYSREKREAWRRLGMYLEKLLQCEKSNVIFMDKAA